MIAIREVTDQRDPAIAGFGRMQQSVYYAPETLIPASMIASLLEDGGRARRNVLLVAESDGRVVGGTLFHAFRESRTGFSSFLGVAREARGQGVARRLHVARFEALERLLEGPVHGVFIDVVSPVRMAAEEIAREHAVGSDPCGRRRAFQRLGFRQVNVRYEQPVGGPDGGPVRTLDLLFCPRQPADTVPLERVTETMRAYWGPWLGAARASRHAAELAARAAGDPVDLLPADSGCA